MPKLPRSVNRSKTEPDARPKSNRAGKGRGKGDGNANGKAPAAATTAVAEGPAPLDPPTFEHRPVDQAAGNGGGVTATIELNDFERSLLSDLFAVIEEHAGDSVSRIDRTIIERAFVFACERHADQRRQSGEDFIVHPVGVAKICAGMRLDTATLCAALLHDTVEDTSASLTDVRDVFGEEVANLVDGVTKLTGITFQSRDDRQAENYRKMIVAMSSDIRVILIKLADRLHNMRTIGKQKQMQKAKETLEVYAPLAHRLGIHAIKWELEDLAFATLHPRKFKEIKGLVNQQRNEREGYVTRAGTYLHKELEAVGIDAAISGRAKHFYSIYSKMTKKGREFNEIYDLTAMRVLVDSVKDCYGAIGVIHSLWKPLPGRFKDFVAMPKFNMYQALHTTVIGPEGRPLEIQIRTREMHETAEYGIAAHWLYKDKGYQNGGQAQWLESLLDWQKDLKDPQEFVEGLKVDLFEDEVFVFTPKGEVKSIAAGATPLDFAYEIHTDVGHRCVGAKVNGKIVPLHYELKSGDICEVLTSKKERGPSRDWLALAKTTRAQSKIRAWFKRERREDSERTGREILHENLKRQGPAVAEDHRLAAARRRDPRDGLQEGRRVLHRARPGQDLGHRRRQQADAAPQAGRGRGRAAQRRRGAGRRQEEGAGEADRGVVDLRHQGAGHRRRDAAARQVLPAGAGRPDRRLHLARQGHHDPPRGLLERARADEEPGAVHQGGLGRRRRAVVPRRAAGRRLGPHPPARGPLAHVRRERREHPRGALHRGAPDGEEQVRGRGGGHRRAEGLHPAAAQHRLRVRRVPHYPEILTVYPARMPSPISGVNPGRGKKSLPIRGIADLLSLGIG